MPQLLSSFVFLIQIPVSHKYINIHTLLTLVQERPSASVRLALDKPSAFVSLALDRATALSRPFSFCRLVMPLMRFPTSHQPGKTYTRLKQQKLYKFLRSEGNKSLSFSPMSGNCSAKSKNFCIYYLIVPECLRFVRASLAWNIVAFSILSSTPLMFLWQGCGPFPEA